jgi:hypothetical protein
MMMRRDLIEIYLLKRRGPSSLLIRMRKEIWFCPTQMQERA